MRSIIRNAGNTQTGANSKPGTRATEGDE